MIDWLVEHDKAVEAIAAALFILTVLLPQGRYLLVRIWRFLRSLPGRLPLRVVRNTTLDGLRAIARNGDPTPVPADDKPRKPMTLPERCEKFAQEIEDYIGRMDHLPTVRGAGMGFRWMLAPAWELRNELVRTGYAVPALDRLLYDPEGIGRPEAEAIMTGLRSIDWKQG